MAKTGKSGPRTARLRTTRAPAAPPVSRWQTVNTLIRKHLGVPALLGFMLYEDGSASCITATGQKYRFTAREIEELERSL